MINSAYVNKVYNYKIKDAANTILRLCETSGTRSNMATYNLQVRVRQLLNYSSVDSLAWSFIKIKRVLSTELRGEVQPFKHEILKVLNDVDFYMKGVLSRENG